MATYQPTKLTITNWAEEDRPREKLILKGKDALSDSELIAILLGSGSRNLSAVDLAKQILNSVDNDINKLARLNVSQLTKFEGMGEAKAISIIAALELGRRRKQEDVKSNIISFPNQVYELMKPELMDLQHEEFWVVFLDRKNQVIKKQRISEGGIAGTVVDNKLIFKFAVECLASSIVLVHNHPSGNLKPSDMDIKITKTLKEAAKLLDITIFDHIIFTNNNFYSFAHEELL
jgi:DNA repair protein RadC